MSHPMKSVLSLSALSVFMVLALASCSGGTTAKAPSPTDNPVAVSDADIADDTFADDDDGEVTAEKTIILGGAQARALSLTAQDAGPIAVTASILRATTGKYAGQVKGKLVLNYSGNVTYKGDFALKIATAPDAGGTSYLISKRKNDSKDNSYVTLTPIKNKPATIKNLTMQYGNALNGAACIYLSYDLRDNKGAGPAQISLPLQSLLCEPDGSSQASVQVALLSASAGYLYGDQPWQFVSVSGPAAPAATLSELPVTLAGAPKQDFEAFFAPLMTAPVPADPAKPTQAEKDAAVKAKQAKKLHDAYLKLFKPAQLGVYVTATETQVVGVNSWGVVGLKSN